MTEPTVPTKLTRPQRAPIRALIAVAVGRLRSFDFADIGLFLLVFAWLVRGSSTTTVIVGLILGAMAWMALSIAAWWRTTHHLVGTDGAGLRLVVNGGVFRRTQTVIPTHRIKAVRRTQRWLPGLLNLNELVLETEGGDQPELHLAAIDVSDAKLLEQSLEANRSSAATEPTAVRPRLLVRLEPRHLLRFSFLRPSFFGTISVFVVLNAVAALLGRFWSPQWLDTDWLDENVHPLYIIPVALALLVVTWLAQGIATFVRYKDLTVTTDDNDVVVEHGWLTNSVHRCTIRSVKSIEANQGPLLRRLGLHVVGLAMVASGDDGSSTISFPATTANLQVLRRRLTAEPTQIMDRARKSGSSTTRAVDLTSFRDQQIAPAYIYRLVRNGAVLLTIAALGVGIAVDALTGSGLGFIGLLAVPLLTLARYRMARRFHRFYRWTAQEEHISVGSGSVFRERKETPYSTITTVTVTQNRFERRRGLASINMTNTANSFLPLTIELIDHQLARSLRDVILFKIESNAMRKRD